MFYPSKKEFIRLAKRGNLIPVYTEILADLETPASAFMKIDRGEYSYLLESVEGGEKIARYSFLGSNPSLVFKSKGPRIQIIRNGKSFSFVTKKDPLFEIKKLMDGFKFVSIKGLPRFCGGLVGYIGYDMVRFFEELPDENIDDLKLPDAVFVLTDTLLIFDHLKHKIMVVSNAHIGDKAPTPRGRVSIKSAGQAYDEAIRKIETIVKRLKKPLLPGQRNHRPIDFGRAKIEKLKSNFTKNKYERIVLKAKEYIRAGDVIQVVLSQRFQKPLRSDPFDVYRALRSINPSPYMYFLKFKDLKLIGSSPEIMVRCEDRIAQTRPIAGTRPRGKSEEEDSRLMKELLADPKERAEHIMLVDLGRNDIGRVCDFGTVRVPELMTIEKYSHVMHIVSDVVGKLSETEDQYDLLRATFPAGTVAGAPKIRAMEIIDALENIGRGPYAGAVGYFSFSGNVDTCITIRTIVVKDQIAYVQAGAGIVADSVPEREYQETVNKAKGMLKAIDRAEEGLA